MKKTSLALILFTKLALLDSAQAIFIRHDVNESDYFTLAGGYDSVVRVDTPGSFGSGTLVSPTHILTAAHVVDNEEFEVRDTVFTDYSIRFGDNVGGANADLVVSNIVDITINPQWTATNGDRTFDLAVITLGTSVTGFTPFNITDMSADGQIGSLVGYGFHGIGTDSDAGSFDNLRRAAQNEFVIRPDDTMGIQNF